MSLSNYSTLSRIPKSSRVEAGFMDLAEGCLNKKQTVPERLTHATLRLSAILELSSSIPELDARACWELSSCMLSPRLAVLRSNIGDPFSQAVWGMLRSKIAYKSYQYLFLMQDLKHFAGSTSWFHRSCLLVTKF
jgi:hypothetical protein